MLENVLQADKIKSQFSWHWIINQPGSVSWYFAASYQDHPSSTLARALSQTSCQPLWQLYLAALDQTKYLLPRLQISDAYLCTSVYLRLKARKMFIVTCHFVAKSGWNEYNLQLLQKIFSKNLDTFQTESVKVIHAL